MSISLLTMLLLCKIFFHSNRCYVKNAPFDSLYLITYEYIIMAMIFVTFRHL